MVAGVSRDILTKFQENRSSRFQSHRVLLYFWSFFGNLHRVPPMEKKFKFFFRNFVFCSKTRPNVVSECLVLENHKKHVLRVITAYMPNSATVKRSGGV